MSKDLSSYRKNYEKGDLLESKISKNPLELFEEWFQEAEKIDTQTETNAMNIASIGLDGYPKNRIVLLKGFSDLGFTFFTNYNSEKGKAIEKNNKVCASFFWEAQERQVIIKGDVVKLTEQESVNYFNQRPEGSRIGAWASPQSEVVPSREFLQNNIIHYSKEFQEKTIEKPPHWGGYIIKPISIEFWQGRPNRMHDRIRYAAQKNAVWKIERLAP